MGITEGMDVPHGAVDPRRGHFENLDATGRIDPPGRAADDLRIVRALDGDVGPGVELQAVFEEQVGSAQPEHEARPDLHLVSVLGAARERLDVHEIAADLLDEGFQVGDRRHDAQLVGALRVGEGETEHAESTERESQGAHHITSSPRPGR